MKYFLLFMLLASFASGETFSVGLTIQGCDSDFDSYEQLSAAIPNGSMVSLRAPVEVSSAGNCSITIPAEFLNATNFTAYENGTQLATTRSGSTVYWNAGSNTNTTINYLASPPVLTTVVTETATSYQVAITVVTNTSLRNSTYNVTVPAGLQSFTLTETLGGTIDRTSTYALQTNSTQATFSNVFFTSALQQRSLTLNAAKASAAPGRNDRNPDAILAMAFSFPKKIESVRGTASEDIIMVNNYGSLARTVTITDNSSEVSIIPASLRIEPKTIIPFTIKYNPASNAVKEKALIQVNIVDRVVDTALVDLIPLDPQPQPSFEVDIDNGKLVVNGTSPSGVYVFLRTVTGAIVRERTIDIGNRFELAFELTGLQPGTYELCARTNPSSLQSEHCIPVRVPVSIEEESPGVVEAMRTPFLIISLILAPFVVIFLGNLVVNLFEGTKVPKKVTPKEEKKMEPKEPENELI